MFFKVIVGLGNYGVIYHNTRHNIGFSIVDHFARKFNASWKFERFMSAFILKISREGGNLILVKSHGFMNISGTSVSKVCSFFKIQSNEVIVICDDITLNLGEIKITERSGTAGHNGVKNILEKIGPGFVRFRVGIGGKKHPEMDLADYVLGRFNDDETEILAKKMPNICNNLQLLLDKGVLSAMNFIKNICEQNLTERP